MGFLRAATIPSIGEWAAWRGIDAGRRRVVAAGLLLAALAALLLAAAGARQGASQAPPHQRLAAPATAAALPASAQAAVSGALGAHDPAYAIGPAASGGLRAQSTAQSLRMRFTRSGVEVRAGATHLALSLRAIGFGERLAPIAPATPSASANGVAYAHAGGLTEWYRNGPLGLEQGFTIARAPAGADRQPLTLAMALSGDVAGRLAPAGQTLTLGHAGGPTLRYGALTVTDARGRMLRSRLGLRGSLLSLLIDARGARYPLHVDPLIQQGPKLTGSGEVKAGEFGLGVAISANGTTAIVGGPADNTNVGAAWVFTRSGSTWTQQGPKLTASGESGEGQFGYTVALSADGNTALIGGGKDNKSVGAGWVFTRSGSTWTQQGSKLTGGGESGEGHFGCCAVALSADGNTALIGGYADKASIGAAWVFTREGSTWSQQGEKLTGGAEEKGAAHFGYAVSLSSDGNTALIGGGFDNAKAGAAWVFTRSESKWSQQGPKLVGSGATGAAQQGLGVALSGDGNTALIGGGADNSGVGAAWVFTRSGSTWSQQGSKLTGGEEVGAGHFGGYAVALSENGSFALIGGYADHSGAGAAWNFARVGSTWTQQGPKMTGGEETLNEKGEPESVFGRSVSLSADGRTAFIGGYADNSSVGAAWAFAASGQAPVVNTEAVSNRAQTSVTLNATVNPREENVTDCHFEYGTTEAYGSSVPCSSLPGSGTSPVPVSAPVSGLVANTPYHFRISATNAAGTTRGSDREFTTTESQKPAVVTGAATNFAQTTATLNATVNPEDETVSDCHFEYWTTEEASATSVPCASLPGSGTSPVPVSAALTGLASETTYHFRISATNPAGPSKGSDEEFKTTESKPPVVVTLAASEKAQTTATLNATVNPEDETVSDCHFEYWTTEEASATSIPCASLPETGTSPVPVSAALTGLASSTVYHYRISATNPTGTSVGSQPPNEFTTTESKPPAVVTLAASEVAQTTATLNATVNPEDETVSDCHFEYGTTETYGSSIPCSKLPGSGTSPVAVSAALTELSPHTIYHYRISATNPTGTSHGSDAKFETTAFPPTVVTGSASSIGENSAVLGASVNPNGANVTDCHFDYGTSEAYGSSIPCSSLPGSGSSPVAVSASLSGLAAHTTYHFRVSATSAAGTSHGSDASFTTATPALPELGRCVTLAKSTGKYKTSVCTTTSTGEDTGKFEWQPWPAAKNGLSVKGGGAATLESIHKATIKCTGNSLTGEYTGPQSLAMSIVLTECVGSGLLSGKCQTEGAAFGEIRTNPLVGQMGVIKAGLTPTIGWELQPAVGSTLAGVKCGASELALTGSVIGTVTAVDKMSTSFAIKFKATTGKQSPERFEGGVKQTLAFLANATEEQAGLTLSDTIVNEEAVEIKAIA